jgi:diguanylate cyclase (GGDEF)-like protein
VAEVIAFCLVLTAGLGAAFAHVVPPHLLVVFATTYFVPIVGDLATAAVLLATWSFAAPHRSTFALGLTYAVVGALTLLQVLTLPLADWGISVVPAGTQAAVWLGVAAHAVAAAGAITYTVLRHEPSAHVMATRRFANRSVALAALVTVAVSAALLGFSDYLPHLVQGGELAGLRTTGVGPILFLLCLGATLVTLRIPRATEIDRALMLSLLANALNVGLSLLDTDRFSVSWYVARLLLTAGAWFVLIAAIRSLISARKQLGQTEVLLSTVETQSTKYADRVLAVWRIASAEASSSDDRLAAILDVATQALRPGKPMFGYLTRLEDDTIVVEAVSWSGPEKAAESISATIYPGARFALASTTLQFVYSARSTQAWDDLDVFRGEDMVYRGLGWHSIIAAPLQIGRVTHFISFASPESMRDEPYEESDIAYVDVVASFFTQRFAQQQQVERIQFQMEHDALTGLPNRVQFRMAVRAAIAEGAPFALAIVDIDGFRHINEAEGHQVADELLVEVAAALRSAVDGNLAARLAGDEFAILTRGVTTAQAAPESLTPYAEIFHRPFNTGDRDGTRTLTVGASIGVAHFPEHGATVEELMRCAETAMGISKERGGSAMIIFDRASKSLLEHTRIRTLELAEAIARDQLVLLYQPTFELATREIIGAEALVRWDHPERGRLAPVEFIPLAERTQLIGPLSRWVLRRLIRDLSSWQALPMQFRCYMNLSPQQLGDVEFIAEMEELLGAVAGLQSHIGIEITETAVMQNVERSMQTIDLFREWGLRVAIDDFGTGYSSLSYLKRLPIDMIKIDRSFVTGLPDDDKDASLVNLLLQMSEGFGLTTLAEGIETEAQAAWLLAHGCRYGQGFLVDQPLPFDQLVERAATNRPRVPHGGIRLPAFGGAPT